MRDFFPGYFSPTEAEFTTLWRTAIIVPDANILLHTLRYDAQTRREVLDALRSLKEQVWIPYQVGLEFLRNWRDVDAENRAIHLTVQKLVADAGNSLQTAFDQASRHQTINAKGEKEKIKQFMEGLRSSLEEAEKKHPDKASAEAIVDEIADLIGNAVGAKPTPEQVSEWEAEGRGRFEAKIPPGYMDRKKEGIDKYGDLFVWKEVLARGAEKQVPTIMITDDKKEDIAWSVKGERVGPHPKLVDEYRVETGQIFYSYTLDAFLKHAKKYIQSDISDATIEAVQRDARNRAVQKIRIEAAKHWKKSSSSDRAYSDFYETVMRGSEGMSDDQRRILIDYLMKSTHDNDDVPDFWTFENKRRSELARWLRHHTSDDLSNSNHLTLLHLAEQERLRQVSDQVLGGDAESEDSDSDVVGDGHDEDPQG